MTTKFERREELKSQIVTWQNRAAMAKKQGSLDLEKSALDKAKEYELLLEVLDEEDTEDPDDDGYANAPVPKRPHPSGGSAEAKPSTRKEELDS